MEDRIVEFISALRNAGVRVSVAESADALRAVDAAGIANRELFRLAMRAALVKEAHDFETYEKLFPAFFGSAPPPMQQPGGGLSEEDREKLADMLEEMLRTMSPEQLRRLFESMMKGEPMSSQEMQAMLQDTLDRSQLTSAYYQPWATRRAMRDIEFDRLDELLQELLEKLREAGVSEEALQQLAQEARENQQALAEQLAQEIGSGMAQREAEEQNQRRPNTDDLLDKPFEYLGHEDADALRGTITRLASQLRSRAALRQKRGNQGTLDAKSTIRANLRYHGVPLELRFRKKHLKPKLTVLCDLSTSMRPVVTFMLLLVYGLQDQVARTRSFAFVSDLHDISPDFNDGRPEVAIREVLQRIRPGHYNTDLGNSLATFARDYMAAVDRRTTVIILGDGRNNHFDPNLRDLEAIKRRARRVVWFNPEAPRLWGTGDSDMLSYEPLCDTVHQVANLRQLVAAVDSLFG